jgi:2,4-dienoyl-CoA reductase (NADPH2)
MCCAVNPAVGQEYRGNLIHSSRNLPRVLVIGGGPAGMEAARTLAQAGCRVSLWEREKDLGGTTRVAALAYEPNGRLIDYLAGQLESQVVDVQLGKTADLESIRAHGADTVIVAIGARRAAPAIPGKEQRHVFDGDELRGVLFGNSREAMAKLGLLQRWVVRLGQFSQLMRSIAALRLLSKLWMPLARRITIVGGGLVGLELAEYLVERGRKVTVLEPSSHLGAELSIVRRARVVHELREHGCEMLTGVEINRIGSDTVEIVAAGEQCSIAADQVIIALGAQANDSLSVELQAAGIDAISIGDCSEVAYIEGAVRSGREAALAILEKQQ